MSLVSAMPIRQRIARALVRAAVCLDASQGWSAGTGDTHAIADASGRIAILSSPVADPAVADLIDVFSRAPHGVGFVVDRKTLRYRPLNIPKSLLTELVDRGLQCLRRRSAEDELAAAVGHGNREDRERKNLDPVDASFIVIPLHGSPLGLIRISDGEGAGRARQGLGRLTVAGGAA